MCVSDWDHDLILPVSVHSRSLIRWPFLLVFLVVVVVVVFFFMLLFFFFFQPIKSKTKTDLSLRSFCLFSSRVIFGCCFAVDFTAVIEKPF